MLNKFSEKYQFYLNGDKIDLDTIVLDSRNIKSVIRDKKTNSIYIKEKEVRKLYKFEDNGSKKDSITCYQRTLIILDGIPIAPSVYIDTYSIKNITILKKSDLNSINLCRRSHRDIMLITTLLN